MPTLSFVAPSMEHECASVIIQHNFQAVARQIGRRWTDGTSNSGSSGGGLRVTLPMATCMTAA